MLAVDREELASPSLPCRKCEIAGGYEALLVREREGHSALERPQRRSDAGEADDGVQDEIGLGGVEELGQVAPDLDVLDVELGSQLGERLRP